MRFGVVNFMKSGRPDFLYDALGDDIVIVSHKTDWLSAIRTSRIKHWFLSGSAYDVLQTGTPQITTELLTLTNKRFFLICYSMESLLLHLGCKLIKRPKNARGYFSLSMDGKQIDVWRNHYTYIVPDSLKPGMRCLATYDGETMTVEYKNTMMTQWHPERTEDGVRFIRQWLNRKN